MRRSNSPQTLDDRTALDKNPDESPRGATKPKPDWRSATNEMIFKAFIPGWKPEGAK